MEEREFRNRVSWMMFLLSILVIWVHSYNLDLFQGGQAGEVWDAAYKIEDFFSVGIGQTAVPGFFLLSSYLFFRNFTWKKLPGKWKGRFFSIAVPYIAWNVLYYAGYAAASRLPAVAGIVGKEPLPLTLGTLADAVAHYRYAPIFWYLYQLIFLIALSPVVYTFVKKKAVGAAWLLALAFAVHFHLDMQHPNTDALFYYSFGAYMAVHFGNAVENGTGKELAAGGIALFLAAACYGKMTQPGADVLWTVFYRLFMPLALWLFLSLKKLPAARPWMRQSLFLYGIHYLVVRSANKVFAVALSAYAGQSRMAFAALGLYFVLPAFVVFVSYICARILSGYLPLFWRIFSGGRSLDG